MAIFWFDSTVALATLDTELPDCVLVVVGPSSSLPPCPGGLVLNFMFASRWPEWVSQGLDLIASLVKIKPVFLMGSCGNLAAAYLIRDKRLNVAQALSQLQAAGISGEDLDLERIGSFEKSLPNRGLVFGQQTPLPRAIVPQVILAPSHLPPPPGRPGSIAMPQIPVAARMDQQVAGPIADLPVTGTPIGVAPAPIVPASGLDPSSGMPTSLLPPPPAPADPLEQALASADQQGQDRQMTTRDCGQGHTATPQGNNP